MIHRKIVSDDRIPASSLMKSFAQKTLFVVALLFGTPSSTYNDGDAAANEITYLELLLKVVPFFGRRGVAFLIIPQNGLYWEQHVSS